MSDIARILEAVQGGNGLELQEIANALNASVKTIQRVWAFAKALEDKICLAILSRMCV